MEFSDIIFSMRNKWGYQNSPECRGYFDRADVLKIDDFWGLGMSEEKYRQHDFHAI